MEIGRTLNWYKKTKNLYICEFCRKKCKTYQILGSHRIKSHKVSFRQEKLGPNGEFSSFELHPPRTVVKIERSEEDVDEKMIVKLEPADIKQEVDTDEDYDIPIDTSDSKWKLAVANFAIDTASDEAFKQGNNIFVSDQSKSLKKKHFKTKKLESLFETFLKEVLEELSNKTKLCDKEVIVKPKKPFVNLRKRSKVRINVRNISQDFLYHHQVVRHWRRRIKDGDITSVDYGLPRKCTKCSLVLSNAIDMFRHIRDAHIQTLKVE